MTTKIRVDNIAHARRSRDNERERDWFAWYGFKRAQITMLDSWASYADQTAICIDAPFL